MDQTVELVALAWLPRARLTATIIQSGTVAKHELRQQWRDESDRQGRITVTGFDYGTITVAITVRLR